MGVKESAVADPEQGLEDNGAPIETDPNNQDDGPQPGREEDTNAGGSGGEVYEAGQSFEKEAPLDVDPRDEKIAQLEAQIKEISGKVSASPAPAPVQLTDEQKEQISQKFGGLPFEQVDAITQYMAQVIGSIKKEFQGHLGQFQKDAVISELAQRKEYADIRSYTPGINEYLKRFSPQYHGREEILQDAYWYAKGRGMKTALKRAQNSGERNRRIAGEGRPAGSGGGSSDNGSQPLKLTNVEMSAWESFGKKEFPNIQDYARSLPRFKKK